MAFEIVALIVILILVLAAFVILASFSMSTRHQKKSATKAGIIVTNTTDPEKDVIRIELDVSIGELITMKNAIFEIENEDS